MRVFFVGPLWGVGVGRGGYEACYWYMVGGGCEWCEDEGWGMVGGGWWRWVGVGVGWVALGVGLEFWENVWVWISWESSGVDVVCVRVEAGFVGDVGGGCWLCGVGWRFVMIWSVFDWVVGVMAWWL